MRLIFLYILIFFTASCSSNGVDTLDDELYKLSDETTEYWLEINEERVSPLLDTIGDLISHPYFVNRRSILDTSICLNHKEKIEFDTIVNQMYRSLNAYNRVVREMMDVRRDQLLPVEIELMKLRTAIKEETSKESASRSKLNQLKNELNQAKINYENSVSLFETEAHNYSKELHKHILTCDSLIQCPD